MALGQSFISGGGAYLEIDASDLQAKIALLRGVMSPQGFNRLMLRTFNEVGRKSRTLIAKEVQKDYEVTQAWVRSNIGGFRLSNGSGGGVTCVIPLSSHKGTIGGRFKLSGRRRAITSRIVKTGLSHIPAHLKNQGGNAPFVGPNGVVFTRRSKARLPIVRVVGLGVPQMPLNRSEDKTADALLEYAMQRLEHNFGYMLSQGVR